MSDELNPFTTSKVSGDDQAAIDKSSSQGDEQPKIKIPPRQRKINKWFGLTKMQWREFSGYMILIPWLWYDLIDSHGFLKLCLLASSLAFAQGLAFSFLKSRWKALAVWIAIKFDFKNLITKRFAGVC
jgi:hypothetical protein